MTRRFDLVIFDCDGVLVDSEPVTLRVLCDYLNELGANLTLADTMRIYIGKSVKEDLELSAGVLGRMPPEGFYEGFQARRDVALRNEVDRELPDAGSAAHRSRVVEEWLQNRRVGSQLVYVCAVTACPRPFVERPRAGALAGAGSFSRCEPRHWLAISSPQKSPC